MSLVPNLGANPFDITAIQWRSKKDEAWTTSCRLLSDVSYSGDFVAHASFGHTILLSSYLAIWQIGIKRWKEKKKEKRKKGKSKIQPTKYLTFLFLPFTVCVGWLIAPSKLISCGIFCWILRGIHWEKYLFSRTKRTARYKAKFYFHHWYR